MPSLLPTLALLVALAVSATATPPAGYTLAAEGLPSGSPMRFATAFNVDAKISETKGLSEAACASSCDAIPKCRGIFYWAASKRCRLLSKANRNDLYATATTSVSYEKTELLNYKLVAIGVNTGGDTPLRFNHPFSPNLIESSSTVVSRGECLSACTASPTCHAVFFYKSGNTWTCNRLKNDSYTLVPTSLEAYSYSKLGVEVTVPSGYTLEAQGETHTNAGSARRFASTFVADALIRQTTGLTMAQCTAACDDEFYCRGVFYWLLANQWRCRLLNILTATTVNGTFEIIPTIQVGFSIKRSVIPTTTTTTTTRRPSFFTLLSLTSTCLTLC